MTSESSMCEAGHLKSVLWDNPEGWNEEGGGRGLDAWLIHVNVWQKPPQYCKVISLQLKLKKKKKECAGKKGKID